MHYAVGTNLRLIVTLDNEPAPCYTWVHMEPDKDTVGKDWDRGNFIR